MAVKRGDAWPVAAATREVERELWRGVSEGVGKQVEMSRVATGRGATGATRVRETIVDRFRNIVIEIVAIYNPLKTGTSRCINNSMARKQITCRDEE